MSASPAGVPRARRHLGTAGLRWVLELRGAVPPYNALLPDLGEFYHPRDSPMLRALCILPYPSSCLLPFLRALLPLTQEVKSVSGSERVTDGCWALMSVTGCLWEEEVP